MNFQPARKPFPRWLGPFSPARGTSTGFRFHDGRLGTWVESDEGRAFWQIVRSQGASALARLVLEHWGGGRVLLLPNGIVVKPLRDEDVGRRVAVGLFKGPIQLEMPDGGIFDFSAPAGVAPGRPWPGPRTTGLECAIQPDGSLRCYWYHPSQYGRDEVMDVLHPPDGVLALGFRRARPADTGGRVSVTANGHVITNRQEPDGTWLSLHVGMIKPGTWMHRKSWIEGSGA